MRISTAVLTTLFISCATQASEPVRQDMDGMAQYEIKIEISKQGKLISSPRLVTVSNAQMYSEVKGEWGYKLAMILSEVENDRVNVDARLEYADGQLLTVEASTLIGQPMRVASGEVQLQIVATRFKRG